MRARHVTCLGCGFFLFLNWLALVSGRQLFDVASVKVNQSGRMSSSLVFSAGGRFTATNATLRELIQVAHGLQDRELAIDQDWLSKNRFDVVAKAEGNPPIDQVRGMIRRLLVDRFKVVTHIEPRRVPVYALVVARTDRRLGANLHPSTVDCAAIGTSGAQPQPRFGDPLRCEMFDAAVPPRFLAAGVTMAQLTSRLALQVDRIVVNRTGLTGAFDFDLQWTPEIFRKPTNPGDPPIRFNGLEINPNGPSIYTALQEQLGLKLEAQEAPVDILVVDSANQPTPD
jgi:uncharacterized protein (TIGR03435 family)